MMIMMIMMINMIMVVKDQRIMARNCINGKAGA